MAVPEPCTATWVKEGVAKPYRRIGLPGNRLRFSRERHSRKDSQMAEEHQNAKAEAKAAKAKAKALRPWWKKKRFWLLAVVAVVVVAAAAGGG